MEIFTKKNILIGLAVLVAIPVVLTVGVKAYDRIDLYAYRNAKKAGIELGKDYETLTKNIHSILKNKKRDDAYALYCPDGGDSWRLRKGKDEGFNYSWQNIEQEDYSESGITFDDSDDNYNYYIVVDNIKTKDGQIKSRNMPISSTGVFGESFKCLNNLG